MQHNLVIYYVFRVLKHLAVGKIFHYYYPHFTDKDG